MCTIDNTSPEDKVFPTNAEVIICGGGAMGAAVAYYLGLMGWGPQTVLVEQSRRVQLIDNNTGQLENKQFFNNQHKVFTFYLIQKRRLSFVNDFFDFAKVEICLTLRQSR